MWGSICKANTLNPQLRNLLINMELFYLIIYPRYEEIKHNLTQLWNPFVMLQGWFVCTYMVLYTIPFSSFLFSSLNSQGLNNFGTPIIIVSQWPWHSYTPKSLIMIVQISATIYTRKRINCDPENTNTFWLQMRFS